jgi:ribosome-binding protein aMBF1 (putative translation factor)
MMSETISETATAMKECPVCYDEIASTNNCITSCGHSFCLSCMLKCIQTNNSCPCCRTSLIEKKYNIIDYDNDDSDDDDSDIDNDGETNYDSESDMSSDYGDWLRERREAQRIQREQREHRIFEDGEIITIGVDGTIYDDDEISIWEDIETDDDENYDDDDTAVDVDTDSKLESEFIPHPQWESVRNCEQQVVDIDVNWLMSMCR